MSSVSGPTSKEVASTPDVGPIETPPRPEATGPVDEVAPLEQPDPPSTVHQLLESALSHLQRGARLDLGFEARGGPDLQGVGRLAMSVGMSESGKYTLHVGGGVGVGGQAAIAEGAGAMASAVIQPSFDLEFATRDELADAIATVTQVGYDASGAGVALGVNPLNDASACWALHRNLQKMTVGLGGDVAAIGELGFLSEVKARLAGQSAMTIDFEKGTVTTEDSLQVDQSVGADVAIHAGPLFAKAESDQLALGGTGSVAIRQTLTAPPHALRDLRDGKIGLPAFVRRLADSKASGAELVSRTTERDGGVERSFERTVPVADLTHPSRWGNLLANRAKVSYESWLVDVTAMGGVTVPLGRAVGAATLRIPGPKGTGAPEEAEAKIRAAQAALEADAKQIAARRAAAR